MLVLTTIPNKEGGAAQEEGVFNSNGRWGGEVSSAGTPTGQTRVCTACLTRNTVKCDGTASLLLNGDKIFCNTQHLLLREDVRKRRLDIIINHRQTNWTKLVSSSAFAPSSKMQQSGNVCGEFHMNMSNGGGKGCWITGMMLHQHHTPTLS